MKQSHLPIALILSLLVASALCGGFISSLVLYRAWHSPEPNLFQYVVTSEYAIHRPFDQRAWHTAHHTAYRSNVRLQMVDDLLHQNNNLSGWSQADVLTLLGQPHSYVAHGHLVMDGKVDQPVSLMNYGIGRLYSGETLQLDIFFEAGRVVKVYIDES